MQWIVKSKEWFRKRAHTAHARAWLIFLTASEAIFFPIPIDPLLVAILLVRSSKWLRYAFITTVASVVGAFIGYFVGFFFFDFVGQSVISFYGLQEQFKYVKDILYNGVFLFTLVSAIVPIPFKIFVLAAGVTKANLALFMFASILGRGARYFAVAYMTHRFGIRALKIIKRYATPLTVLGFAVLVLYILLQML